MRQLYWLLVFFQALSRVLWRENDYYDIGKREVKFQVFVARVVATSCVNVRFRRGDAKF